MAKLDPGTVAVINAIQESSRIAKIGTDEVARDLNAKAAEITLDLKNHILHDTERFRDLNISITTVGADVKSLISTRSFTYGVWKTIATIGAVAVGLTLISQFVIQYITGAK